MICFCTDLEKIKSSSEHVPLVNYKIRINIVNNERGLDA